MAKTTEAKIQFEVPGTSANLGPGYGFLGLAVSSTLRVSVHSGDPGTLEVERRDDPDATALDPRHDTVVRGVRAAADALGLNLSKEGAHIIVEGNVPRGVGLGTISAGFSAGIGAALRIAEQSKQKEAQRNAQPGAMPSHEFLDMLVALGGDPGHGAPCLVGGLASTLQTNPHEEATQSFRILRHRVHESWHMVLAAPAVFMPTSETKRVLPPTLPHAVATRTSSRVIALLEALETADEEMLQIAIRDEVHVPFRRRLVAGLDEALRAAKEAGAAGATISGHGPGVIAFTTSESAIEALSDAMLDAFHEAGTEATAL